MKLQSKSRQTHTASAIVTSMALGSTTVLKQAQRPEQFHCITSEREGTSKMMEQDFDSVKGDFSPENMDVTTGSAGGHLGGLPFPCTAAGDRFSFHYYDDLSFDTLGNEN